MEDVRWFHRDWINAAVARGAAAAAAGSGGSGSGGFDAGPGSDPDFGGFEIPGPYSLAHKLITGWLREGSSSSSSGGSGDDASSSGSSARQAWAGDEMPQVSIASGVFKYVLMRVHGAAPDGDGTAARSKLLVWGHPDAAYHNHIYQRARAAAARLGLRCDVLGGGRIEHNPEQRKVAVYGYSAAFGPAPHEVSAALLRRWLPLYGAEGVTVSYDGY
jgi:phosphohistidine phosphatase